MNHRYCLAPQSLSSRSLSTVALALLVLGTCVPVFAQSTTSVPSDLKTAADARSRAEVVKNFLKTQVTALQNEKEPAAQQKARDLIVRESSGVGATASPSYLDVYATALNEQLLPLAKSENPRTRLLAAITLQRVARNANNAKLADAAAAFAADPIAGVALWAVKASQTILPTLAAAGTPHKLTGAIVSAVQTHSTSGDLTEEAYKALTLDLKYALVTEKSVPVVAPDVLKLVEFRVGRYVELAPPRPELEVRGINFLTLGRLWDTKDGAKLRPAIMQQISNLIGVASQHAVAREESERKSLLDQLQKVGDALMAVGARPDMKDSKLQAAGKALKELQGRMPEVEITDRANAAFEAIKEKFPKVTPAPKIKDTAALELSAEEIAETESSSESTATTGPAPAPAPAPGKAAPRSPTTAPAPAKPAPRTPAPAPAR